MSGRDYRYDECPECGGRKRDVAHRCRACWAKQDLTPVRRALLLSRLDTSGGPDACWPYTGRRDAANRGVFSMGPVEWRASRVAYQFLVEPIPEGLHVLHTCDNPPCCNPEHLWLGTHADNMADMARKGRAGMTSELMRRIALAHEWARGEANPLAKLTDQAVRTIRASSEPTRALAERYGVHRTTISRIRLGQRWRYVA